MQIRSGSPTEIYTDLKRGAKDKQPLMGCFFVFIWSRIVLVVRLKRTPDVAPGSVTVISYYGANIILASSIIASPVWICKTHVSARSIVMDSPVNK